MLKITFSESDVQALQQQRFAHPEAVVRVKMDALYLKSQGVAHQDIARWWSSPSLMECKISYNQTGGMQNGRTAQELHT